MAVFRCIYDARLCQTNSIETFTFLFFTKSPVNPDMTITKISKCDFEVWP